MKFNKHHWKLHKILIVFFWKTSSFPTKKSTLPNNFFELPKNKVKNSFSPQYPEKLSLPF